MMPALRSVISHALLACAFLGCVTLYAETTALDLSKLPLPPGTKKVYADANQAIHSTKIAQAETTEACKKLLLEQGWEPYGVADITRYYKRGTTRLLVTVQSSPAQGGSTMITYMGETMSADLPLPPDAEEVQYRDKQLGFLAALKPEEVADFYRKALAPGGWSTNMEKPVENDFKHVIIFRSDKKEMIRIEMTPTEGKVRSAVLYSTAAEVALEEQKAEKQKAALMGILAKKASTPTPKVSLTLPASTSSKALTKQGLRLNLPASEAKAAVEAMRKELLAAGWKESSASLQAPGGIVSLTQEDRSLNITYLDPGFMAAEISVTPVGVEIELAGK
jgi:hypothetical protein